MSVVGAGDDVDSDFAILLVLVEKPVLDTEVTRARWEASHQQADRPQSLITMTAATGGRGITSVVIV